MPGLTQSSVTHSFVVAEYENESSWTILRTVYCDSVYNLFRHARDFLLVCHFTPRRLIWSQPCKVHHSNKTVSPCGRCLLTSKLVLTGSSDVDRSDEARSSSQVNHAQLKVDAASVSVDSTLLQPSSSRALTSLPDSTKPASRSSASHTASTSSLPASSSNSGEQERGTAHKPSTTNLKQFLFETHSSQASSDKATDDVAKNRENIVEAKSSPPADVMSYAWEVSNGNLQPVIVVKKAAVDTSLWNSYANSTGQEEPNEIQTRIAGEKLAPDKGAGRKRKGKMPVKIAAAKSSDDESGSDHEEGSDEDDWELRHMKSAQSSRRSSRKT